MAIQSDADLQQHLDEQVSFIQTSCIGYDAGKWPEAKRLALHIRLLVHDTKQSKSLLTQLKMSDRLFHDTAAERPLGILSSYSGLTGVRVEPGPARYVPSLDTWPTRLVTLQKWWHGVIIADVRRREISRRTLVLDMANQDGGAHVDPKLSDIYAELSRGNSMGHTHGVFQRPVTGVDHASIRQIAHEVLGTLQRERPTPAVKPGEVTIHNPMISISPKQLWLLGIKIGRNDPCPCGSGKKYKACCGIE